MIAPPPKVVSSLDDPQTSARRLRIVVFSCVALFIITLLIIFALYKTDDDFPASSNQTNRVAKPPRKLQKREFPIIKEDVKLINPDARPSTVGEVVNGYVMLPSGRIHKRLGVITNSMDSAQFKMPYEIFEYSCENEIACLLELPPGEGLVGTPTYDGRFKEEFIKSLRTPITIDPLDSDYVKAIKEQVKAAKQDLKAALDRGEDIEKIMLDTREEIQKLSIYRMQLEEELNTILSKDGTTEEDVDDCVKAINILLEDKGIAPLDIGPIAKRKLRNILKNKESRQ